MMKSENRVYKENKVAKKDVSGKPVKHDLGINEDSG